jgi:hypothetical protein
VTVRLVPLSPAFRDDIDALQDDPDVQAFTRFPMPREDDFADRFLRRYEDGLAEGVRAGFAAVDHRETFLGLGPLDLLPAGSAGGCWAVVATRVRPTSLSTTPVGY